MDKIGIVDTMFACIDMGSIAAKTLETQDGYGNQFEIVRRTVPGFKDLAAAAKQLIERDGCKIVIACGMPGGAELDRLCAHEASLGITYVQALTGIHVLEVFVHTSEETEPKAFDRLCRRRVESHAVNAYWMLYRPNELRKRAGQGIRQGAEDFGPLHVE